MRLVRSAPPEALIEQVAHALVQAVQQTLSRQERFRIALSGGSTPRALYERLACPDFREAVDWTRVRFFWGDERYVPHDHPQSNFRMAFEAWLGHLSLPEGCLFPMPTDCADPNECARQYEATLRMEFFDFTSPPNPLSVNGEGERPASPPSLLAERGDGGERFSDALTHPSPLSPEASGEGGSKPLPSPAALGEGLGVRAYENPSLRAEKFPTFDLILLGMGDDGHTASLFPSDPALNEGMRWVMPATAPFEPHQRLTLTLPVLNNAHRVWFLVVGQNKQTMLQRVFNGEPLPAGLVQPAQGELIWWLDETLAQTV